MAYLMTMKKIEAYFEENLPKGAIAYYKGESEGEVNYEISYTDNHLSLKGQKELSEKIVKTVWDLGGSAIVRLTVEATFPTSFAEELKASRHEAKLSQSMMSSMFDIAKRTIESWEEGKRKPPFYVQKLILEKLHDLSAK